MTAVINKVREEWGCLSNMSKHPVVFGGIEYPRAEHLFQALRLTCPELREQVRMEPNPVKAKLLARQFFVEHPEKVSVMQRSMEDVENMRFVLEEKLRQSPEVQKTLLLTGTQQIVEDCTRRQGGTGLFWGAALQEDGTWKGHNWLGHLWMQIREGLGE